MAQGVRTDKQELKRQLGWFRSIRARQAKKFEEKLAEYDSRIAEIESELAEEAT